jgi:hypothetical protein
MGDAVIIGEEDEEAVEAEDVDKNTDKGMEVMEITMEDVGKGVGGRQQGGATMTTHNMAVVSHLAAAVERGGGSTLRRLRMTSQGGSEEGGDSTFP